MANGLDIEGILDRLGTSGNGGGGGGSDKKNDMTEAEQADQLIEVLTAHSNPAACKPGDFVRYRKDTRAGVKHGERLHIVLERVEPPITLPPAIETVTAHVGTCRYDTIVGVTDARDKGHVLRFYADSRWLEPYPGGERLKPKLS